MTVATHVLVSVGGGHSRESSQSAFEYIDVWSSPWTWGGNEPPIQGDLVVITQGQHLMLDSDTPLLKVLLIQGGALTFDPTRDIHLQAEYILITDGGALTVSAAYQKLMFH